MSEDSAGAIARQWAMLQAIPRNPLKTTTSELEQRLRDDGYEITRRTIERDLQTLSARFPLVVDDRARPYGWSWAKSAHFEFMPKLTPAQSVALLLARTHLQKLLPETMHKELDPLFDGAEQALASSGWKDWHKRTAIISSQLALIPPQVPADVMASAQSALARNCCLKARYRAKGSKESKEMLLHPLGLLSRGPVLYLICTIFEYSDVRQLALHRMSSPELTTTPCRTLYGFDFQRYAKAEAPKLLSKGTIRLKAYFKAPAAEHLRETPLSKDQTWRELGNGKVEICATIEADETLRWWLMGFGGQVEVVEPAELRSFIAEEAAIAHDIYNHA